MEFQSLLQFQSKVLHREENWSLWENWSQQKIMTWGTHAYLTLKENCLTNCQPGISLNLIVYTQFCFAYGWSFKVDYVTKFADSWNRSFYCLDVRWFVQQPGPRDHRREDRRSIKQDVVEFEPKSRVSDVREDKRPSRQNVDGLGSKSKRNTW